MHSSSTTPYRKGGFKTGRPGQGENGLDASRQRGRSSARSPNAVTFVSQANYRNHLPMTRKFLYALHAHIRRHRTLSEHSDPPSRSSRTAPPAPLLEVLEVRKETSAVRRGRVQRTRISLRALQAAPVPTLAQAGALAVT